MRKMIAPLTLVGIVVIAVAAGAAVFQARRGVAEPADRLPRLVDGRRVNELPPAPIRCELVGPASVRAGEPLRVRERFTNTGPVAIVFDMNATAWSSLQQFTVTQDGAPAPYKHANLHAYHLPGNYPGVYKEIRPGETIEQEVDIAADWTISAGRVRIAQRDYLSDVYAAPHSPERWREVGQTSAALRCNELDVEVLPAAE